MHLNFRHLLILMVTAVSLQGTAWAQMSSATGALRCKIFDAQGLQSLPGATLRVLGTATGSVADGKGEATLDRIPAGQAQLVASCLGYTPDTLLIEVAAGQEALLDVYLHERQVQLAGISIESGERNGLAVMQRLDLQVRPVESAQALLRLTPGLFIAQHAGGGKAEQIFLRGFDIDHGTDLALSVDGMPVNMVSHAHGQGYADLHFLIPETVERMDVDKGPYAPRAGNLATAGTIDFQTRNTLDRNLVKLEGGMYHSYRALAMLRLTPAESRANAWLAGEYTFSRGFVESPQNLHRLNLATKYRRAICRRNLLTLSASDFRSQWSASGQIPARAVASGLITRYGSIDPTEGGTTSRSNLQAQLLTDLGKWKLRQQAFASRYTFDLYSNFTFFAADSLRGDQIRQREQRSLVGYQGVLSSDRLLAERGFHQEFGAGLRYDAIGQIGLYHSVARATVGIIRSGAVQELNGFGWYHARWAMAERWLLGGTARLDLLQQAYRSSERGGEPVRNQLQAMLNPRLTLDYFVHERLQLFAKAGSGYHSNDARVVIESTELPSMPRALGADVGAQVKPVANLLVQATGWGLAMAQEFVYVGDAGIVEPSGRSRRMGMDLSVRWQARTWLMADVDVNVVRARGLGDAGTSSYIPLAPSMTSTGGLTVDAPKGLKASLRYRWIADRPADEDWTLTAAGYFLLDGALSYSTKGGYTLGLSGQNLLNARWNEAQFATTSRLRGEPQAVTEIHFTPGTPVAFRLSLAKEF